MPIKINKCGRCGLETSAVLDNGSFCCCACGYSGTALTDRLEKGTGFEDAVKELGIPVPAYKLPSDVEKQVMYSINEDAAKYYSAVLSSSAGQQGMDYLKGRGVNSNSIRNFRLGYAPQMRAGLYAYLKKLGYRDSAIFKAGLARPAIPEENKPLCDTFVCKVVFPIMDGQGRVVAFGGRTLLPDAKPKYRNTQDTPVFDKSRTLYGLDGALKSRKKYMLVCEGYMDVIALHQAGFTNSVASLGTAFTPLDAKILKKYTDQVVLSLDSDEAGRNSMTRLIPTFLREGFKVNVLDMSPYKDPDEFIKAEGHDAYLERMQHSTNCHEFLVNRMASGMGPGDMRHNMEELMRWPEDTLRKYIH